MSFFREGSTMKTFIAAIAFVFAFNPAFAAEEKKAAGPQQERMKNCNKEAADLKGDERKAFMKECLSRDSSAQQYREGKLTRAEFAPTRSWRTSR
jgi:hypothetical protein